MQKKKKKWMRFRHKVVTKLVRVGLGPICKAKYGITVERFKDPQNRPYLILFNHQTAWDQFFVGLAFKDPIYYVASEDIFSIGWVSDLIRYLVAPIPIKKQTSDMQAVKNCVRIAKEGGTIAIAPEGNRTYSGTTEFINPTIAKLVKTIRLPIAFFRIEGGYGVHPRWSDVIRKGKMKAYVSKVVEPEEYKTLSDLELYDMICKELYVDEANADNTYRHKQSAEYLERTAYVCPYCGLSVFESHDDIIRCTKCGREVRYLLTTELQGVGFEFPFRFYKQWYEYQKDFINQLDPTKYLEEPAYRDEAAFSQVILNHKKILIWEQAKLALYGDRIVITGPDGEEKEFPFEETMAVTVLGKNKVNIYYGQDVYQLKGKERFNALKYVNLFHRYKNIQKEDEESTFLGI